MTDACELDQIELEANQNDDQQILVKAKKMSEKGNLAMQDTAYERAIQFYSEASLISGLQNEVLGLLYSNRSHAYLKFAIYKVESGESAAQESQLALQDAKRVIELRHTWWKGYFRAGKVYQFECKWEQAIDMFDRSLALNPESVEVVNCRDECRYDQSVVDIRAHTSSHAMPYSFKEQTLKLNKERGWKIDPNAINEKYEKLMKSKDKKERALACLFFGDLYVQGVDVPQDYKKGAELILEAADADIPEAIVSLGSLYMEGKGVPRNIQKAVGLFERAAEYKQSGLGPFTVSSNYGISHGQFEIGKCYQDGTGKPLDYFQAHLWYKKASDAGHSGAANNLGVLYYLGRGVEKSLVSAKQYWSLAASRGNILALDSLAWAYLEERNFKQAKIWYKRALDAGNVNSIVHKDNFYSILDEARNGVEELQGLFPGLSISGKTMDEVDTTIKNECTSEISRLIEACSRFKEPPSITKYCLVDDSPLTKFWTHLEEISKRANSGHPYAEKLLRSMGYFSEGLEYLQNLCSKKLKPGDIQNAREQCILKLANCFRGTEIVAFLQPSELPVLASICKPKLTSEKSNLDLAARVVYSIVLTYSQSSEILSFSKINCLKYPDEPFFYKIYAAALAVRQMFKDSLEVSEDGLKRHPKHCTLLFCKAGAMKMISNSADEVIAAYKEFIKEAPFDERSIPEAYYNIAYHCLQDGKGKSEEAKMYYVKGLEEEQKLLPCFIPNDSNVKNILEALLCIGAKEGQRSLESNMVGKEQSSRDAVENQTSSIEFQLNPARVQFVVRHRETLKTMGELYSKGFGKGFAIVNLTIDPKNNQTMPKALTNMKEITFRDMHPRKDQVYQKRIIHLLITEDPMIGLFSAIHVVVRDDNGDFLNCSLYNLNHSDKIVQSNLCFGSRISILNPYYRLAGDGSVALRVDEPKSVIYHSSGKNNQICRYCWKEKPGHSCARCNRAKYCSRDCQIEDWKVLKHKLICDLKYFENF